MMGLEQIVTASKQFTQAKLFVVPSALTCTIPLALVNENIIYFPEELSWSTIAKRLEIDDQIKPLKPKQAKSITFKNLNILVAEDNEVNQIYIHELLKTLNVEHEIVHDGYEAVKKCINSKYDLILMDINMPNMDGITATQQILQYEKETLSQHTPIIGLSADAVAKNIAHYMTQGLDAYLVKPLRKQDLITVLQKYFSSHIDTVNANETKIESIMHSNKAVQMSLVSFVSSKIELPAEIVIELFKKFINNSETILTQIHEHHDDPVALKMAIHSLKGISRNLYLEELGDVCEAFEKNLLSLTPDQKQEHLEHIRQTTEKNIRQMKEELI
jgi:CheY-like chemotaxis protein/HPt (histidine-containing phosphotransfer) domain-containing protein